MGGIGIVNLELGSVMVVPAKVTDKTGEEEEGRHCCGLGECGWREDRKGKGWWA